MKRLLSVVAVMVLFSHSVAGRVAEQLPDVMLSPTKSFAQSLWYEFRPHNITVTTVYPGAVDTPLYSLEEKHRKWLRTIGFMMRPEKMAKAGIRALERRRRAVTPGLFTKVAVGACKILPAHAILLVLKIPAIKRLLAKL